MFNYLNKIIIFFTKYIFFCAKKLYMPNKDDEDCGCTGSIDLEKTTKNINFNILKQTRNKNYGLPKSATNHKTNYKSGASCETIARDLGYDKKYGIKSCDDVCKIESKRLHGQKLNCDELNKRNAELNQANKNKENNCNKFAQTYFGEKYNCKQLEKRIEKEKKLRREIEKARFNHMTKIIKGKKTDANGKEEEVDNQNGVQLKLKTLDEDLFIQTYDMGENILVDKHNIWTLEKDGKINKYLREVLNMPKYPTYKEFIIDYFKNDVFGHQDYTKYNSSKMTEIKDMRGGFKDKERMDFDLDANFFRERKSLRKVTISNAAGLSKTEKLWAKYADFDFKTIPADLSDPVKIRGPKDARFLTIPFDPVNQQTAEWRQRHIDYNTSPRLCAIQEKAGSYIGLTPYKKYWKETVDKSETNRKKKGSEPKDWIPSLNKLFDIHEKKITSKIWVFNKRVDRPYTKDEEVDGDVGLSEYNPAIIQYMTPVVPDKDYNHDGTFKEFTNGLSKFYKKDFFPIGAAFHREPGYAQCFSRNRWQDQTEPIWINEGTMLNVFYPTYYFEWPLSTYWRTYAPFNSQLPYMTKDNYRENDISFKSPDHYFHCILYNKVYYWAKNLIDYNYHNENRKSVPVSANLIDFLDIEYMADKPLKCCTRDADTLWDHHSPYEWEFGEGNDRKIRNDLNKIVKDFNKDKKYFRNKVNYKDAYSKGSAIETNFDDIMTDLRNIYNSVKGSDADGSITPYEFRRYWSSKLNFRNEPFVLGNTPFKGCTNLEEVILELKQIKTGGVYGTFDQYFMGLEKLREVELTDSITATGTQTFSGCKRLNVLTMPGVTSIGDRTFENCINLQEFTINDKMNYIHPTAFIGCAGLKKLIIKNKNPRVFNLEVFVGNNKPKVELIELTNTAFNDNETEEKNNLLNKRFWKNFNHSLKRIRYPVKNKDKELSYKTNLEFKYFYVNRAFVYNNNKYTYYKDLSKLPDYLLEDLSNEKLDGVKTVGLNINPTKLPPGYFTLKARNNKYTIFGPDVDVSDASFKLRDYDLNNVDLSGNLIKLTDFNTYDIIYDQPPILSEDYIIKVNRVNKKMIIGPGVNLTNADLTDVNLNEIDITNINFKNAIFNNVIASNVKIDNNSTNNGYKVFEKNNQKYLLGPGLYFDKFDFSNSIFQDFNVSNCVFRNCNFTNVDFQKADLINCSFINCNLTDVKINNQTVLKGLKSNALTYNNVNFNHEKYKIYGNNGNGILIGPKVDLSNQNLSNLDLSRANMTQVIIHKTIINDNTKLPKKVDKSKFIVVKS